MSIRDLFAVPPLPMEQESVQSYADRQQRRAEKNYRTTVELGRKLAQYDKRFANARNHVTECCAAMRTLGMNPMNGQFLMLRNTIRLMKGKNEL